MVQQIGGHLAERGRPDADSRPQPGVAELAADESVGVGGGERLLVAGFHDGRRPALFVREDVRAAEPLGGRARGRPGAGAEAADDGAGEGADGRGAVAGADDVDDEIGVGVFFFLFFFSIGGNRVVGLRVRSFFLFSFFGLGVGGGERGPEGAQGEGGRRRRRRRRSRRGFGPGGSEGVVFVVVVVAVRRAVSGRRRPRGCCGGDGEAVLHQRWGGGLLFWG